MSIKGIEGLSTEKINFELQRGGKFVIYQYCISIVFMTFKRPSEIHFVKADESALAKGLIYTFVSLLLGWWGIPWGPIYTIGSVFTNFRGGQDVTQQVLASVNAAAAQ